jgi:hypothetical protein
MATKGIRKAPDRDVSMAGLITILHQRADFPESKRMAAERGGRLATLEEFIMRLKDDPDLLEGTKGYWLWLGDRPGLVTNGYCRIDYEKGALVPVSEWEWNKLHHQERAFACKGSGPIAVFVDYGGNRLLKVDARFGSNGPAPLVAFAVDEVSESVNLIACLAGLASLARKAP